MKDEWSIETKPETSNRLLRSLALLAVVVGVLVLGCRLFVYSIGGFPLPMEDSAAKVQKVPLTFQSVRDDVFKPHFQEIQWIRDATALNNDQGTYLVKQEVAVDGTDEVNTIYSVKSVADDSYDRVLFNGSFFHYDGVEYEVDQLTASPDLTKAILRTNTTDHYRFSKYAVYWILDVDSNVIVPLVTPTAKVGTFLWSPDSQRIAYVWDNNIYIKQVSSTAQEGPQQITFDGSDQVFYGRPNWVYEEEVYQSDKTMWWSPDSDKLAFLRMDDTEVPLFSIPYYVQDGYTDYPKFLDLKYPKAGYPNPLVEVGVHDVVTTATKLVDVESLTITDKLVTLVVWVSNSKVIVRISNRSSDALEFYLLSPDGNYELVRSESLDNGWFDVRYSTIYVPRNDLVGLIDDGYIDTVVIDGYNHLAYFSPPSAPKGVILTRGKWEIAGDVWFDPHSNAVYFLSTLKSSTERHLYKVNLLDAVATDSVNDPKVISVTDTSKEAFFQASFSAGRRYVVLSYTGPKVPYQTLVDLRDNKVVKTLETNPKLTEALDRYIMPEIRYSVVSLPSADTGTADDILVNAIETLPLNFDPKKQYPLLFYVYGGPGSQMVRKSFNIDFSSAAAAELDCVVVTVDGRGTGFNNLNSMGAQFKHGVRGRLSFDETADQIAAGKLWGNKPYIDSSRTAIWGWSFGGYMTLRTLETDVDRVFKYGCAVAPVTRWEFYDSIYTERYMRTPQDNPQGYKDTAIHNFLSFLEVNRFLIMHGSGDDNVHFQNSLKLVDDLNLAYVDNFDYMVFPDSHHMIEYHNGNYMVYHRLWKWLERSFLGGYL